MTEVWTNWTGDQRCAPVAIERPAGEEELAGVVAHAVARGQHVRAVGSGHSFTDIACTDGVLVSIAAMNKVLAADPASGLVTVQAGATLHQLGPLLAELGLALENQGDIDAQALAGALATSTHGTGAAFANISARVAGLRIVAGSGEVLELTAESDRDGLLAARVSLGALGILSAVTLQCVPLYTLHRHDRPLPLDDVLGGLDEFVDHNDHFEFFVFPYTRTALTRSMRRSDEQPAPTPPWRRWVSEQLLENWALGLVCRAGRIAPAAVPSLNRLVGSAMSENRVQDRAYRVYATERRVRFTEMEYAIPRTAAGDAVQRVLDLVERTRAPILFPLEVRFSAADDALLSSAHARETCYIAVHQYAGMEFESYFRAVEAIMDDYDGRPHWGKRHYHSAATLSGRYPGWERFRQVRARMDPDGVFENDYTRRVLGPARQGI